MRKGAWWIVGLVAWTGLVVVGAGWVVQRDASADALKLHARWVASDKAQTDLFAPEADLLPPSIVDHFKADNLQRLGGWCVALGCTLIGWSVGYTLGRRYGLAEATAAALANRREG